MAAQKAENLGRAGKRTSLALSGWYQEQGSSRPRWFWGIWGEQREEAGDHRQKASDTHSRQPPSVVKGAGWED